MKQKYRRFSDLVHWEVLGLEQKSITVRTYSMANSYWQEWIHKLQPRHLVVEDLFGSIDVRQFKRALNNSNYYEKKLRKANG